MKPQSVGMLLVAAALVIAGVLMEGAQENPWNLAMCYLLPVAAVEGLRRRATLWAWTGSTVVVGLSIYGAAATLGSQHAASPWAALVYVGLVGAVLSSLMTPLRNGGGQTDSSA